jgi:hypothetical protein
VLARVKVLWRTKLLLLVAVTAAFSVAYQWLAHNPVFAPRDLPLTAVDRWAGFEPRWVWVYQSLYLLTGTAPLLARSREEIHAYLRGFGLICAVSFAVFVFVPTRGPRPEVGHATGMYGLLLLYDGPFNAFPSLHAALICYSLGFLRRVAAVRHRGVAAALLVWAGLILWSTLATKEHYLWDLVGGVVLGCAGDWWAWRGHSAAEAAHERALVSSGVASQEGRR